MAKLLKNLLSFSINKPEVAKSERKGVNMLWRIHVSGSYITLTRVMYFFMHIPRGSPKNAFFFWLKKHNEKCSELSFSMKHEENTETISQFFSSLFDSWNIFGMLTDFSKTAPIGPIGQDLVNDVRVSFWCFDHNYVII